MKRAGEKTPPNKPNLIQITVKNNFAISAINVFSSTGSKLKNFNYINNLLLSINFAKDLVSEPANILNPLTYSEKCLKLRKIGLKVKILNKEQL